MHPPTVYFYNYPVNTREHPVYIGSIRFDKNFHGYVLLCFRLEQQNITEGTMIFQAHYAPTSIFLRIAGYARLK